VTRAEADRKAWRKWRGARAVGNETEPPLFGPKDGIRCRILVAEGDSDSIIGEGMTWDDAFRDADRRAGGGA